MTAARRSRAGVAADLYAVLGVGPGASEADLDHAFRDLVRRHHPDTRTTAAAPDGGRDGESDRRLQQILGAYAVLRDPASRAAYDQRREHTPHQAPHPPADVTVRRPPTAGPPLRVGRVPGPPLRVGPVQWQPSPTTVGTRRLGAALTDDDTDDDAAAILRRYLGHVGIPP